MTKKLANHESKKADRLRSQLHIHKFENLKIEWS